MREFISHRVNVRDKLGFLHRLMIEFALVGRMSLEGDLTKCHFVEDQILARDELGLLRRNALYPRQDFIVLRLEPDTIEPIFKQVTVAGLNRAILHVQVEQGGVIQLGAYDNFHPECVSTGPGVSASLLSDLQSKRVLRGFAAAEPSSD